MSEFICGHCFVNFGSNANLNEHHQKVIKTKEQRRIARIMKKFEPILVGSFNAGFEAGYGAIPEGTKTMNFKPAMREIKKIVEGVIKNGQAN